MKNYIIKRKLCAFVLLLALSSLGCRQAPASSPEYYESELKAMRKQKLETARDAKPLKAGYPWEGKKPVRDSLSERILKQERVYQQEIDCLHQTVHGKKKTRLRLRD